MAEKSTEAARNWHDSRRIRLLPEGLKRSVAPALATACRQGGIKVKPPVVEELDRVLARCARRGAGLLRSPRECIRDDGRTCEAPV